GACRCWCRCADGTACLGVPGMDDEEHESDGCSLRERGYSMMTVNVREVARSLMASSLVWDNHGCMPLRPMDEDFLPQLELYRSSGVDVAIINIGFGEQGVEQHLRMLAHFRRWIAVRQDRYLLVRTVNDIHRARETGRL